ncbi:ammonium transporter [Planktothrix agardhii 1801]|nr:ammonium transporter [Planktothrix agardhii 1812]MCF3578146.1 ammonium transporter [Planktothrix agardhii 1812]MCF3625690.1 ammonium transporter [Planktothrix agardhii 1801]
MLTGVFATKSVNPAGFDGLLYGNPGQLIPQIVGVVATYVFAGAGTFVIIKILGSLMELRVRPMVEEQVTSNQRRLKPHLHKQNPPTRVEDSGGGFFLPTYHISPRRRTSFV